LPEYGRQECLPYKARSKRGDTFFRNDGFQRVYLLHIDLAKRVGDHVRQRALIHEQL
jgi:hypothetical protein